MTTHERFEVLYEREFPSVYRAVHLLCGDRSIAEEATQEAFARALSRWGRLGREPWAAGWVTTTALNVARRSLRRRVASVAEPSHEPAPDAGVDLLVEIRRLPRRQQEALILHNVCDLSVSETAAAMGVDPGTIKTHLARARVRLARALGSDESSDPLGGSHG